MPKKEKRYVLKPAFHFGLIPKRDLVLGTGIFILGGVIFSCLLVGLFLSYYYTWFVDEPIMNYRVLSKKHLLMLCWCLSLLGINLASSFAYQMIFSSFNFGKNYKFKFSFLTHTARDLAWIVLMFLVRLITVVLTLLNSSGLEYMYEEIILFFFLSFIILIFRENNHLKKVYKVPWKIDWVKLGIYTLFNAAILTPIFLYASNLNEIVYSNSIKVKYNIELVETSFYKPLYLRSKTYFLADNALVHRKEEFNVSDYSKIITPSVFSYGNPYYYVNNVFYFNALAPMGQVENVLHANSYLGSNNALFAVKPHDEKSHYINYYYQFHYTSDYLFTKKGKTKLLASRRENYDICGTFRPPGPELQFPINFDSLTIYNHEFGHLHLGQQNTYYWHNEMISDSLLEQYLIKSCEASNIVYITYDPKTTFANLVNTIELGHLINNKHKALKEENYLKYTVLLSWDVASN